MKKTLVLCFLFILFSGCCKQNNKQPLTDNQKEQNLKSDSEKIMSFTAGNIRGHKMLYNEGFFVISSSKKAFAYASEKSIESSGVAVARIADSIVLRTERLKKNMEGQLSSSYELAKKTLKTGTDRSSSIFKGTGRLVKNEFDFSKKSFNDAWNTFVYGNISIVKRTEKDVEQIAALPGDYYQAIKNDFSNIYELSKKANKYLGEKIKLSWESSFKKAVQVFNDEYQRSGNQKNSLLALGNILNGYLKAFYHGVAEPSAKTIVESGVKGANYGLFWPGSAVTIITGRTVEATGLSLFYATKTGYKLITPTIEAGLLGGLAMLSLGTIPVSYIGGTGFGALNQVAFTAAAPVAGAGKGLASSSGRTGKYAALVACDIAKGTSEILINQASAGLVLGYNALTAIPAHLFLGSIDTAAFLILDGPRLVLAVATGKIKPGFSVGALPAGTVLDIKRLKQNKDIDVKIVTDDPVVVEKVMERLSNDLRGQNEN